MSRACLSLFALGLAAALPLAGPARGAPADSAHSYDARILGKWLPIEATLGPQAGAQYSRLRATSEYRALIEPVPAQDDPWIAPAWGASFSLRWRSGFTLALAPRRESFGLRTVEDTVSFQGNPYPHALRARTKLSYDVLPLQAGWGWFPGKQRFQARLGAFAAFLDQGDIAWTVDGQPYSGHPRVQVKDSFGGWLAAAEYGRLLGPGAVNLGIEYQFSRESPLTGLKGSFRSDAVQVRLGYDWIVWHR